MPIQIPVGQMVRCQSTIKTQLVNAVRSLERNSKYMLVRDQLNSYLQKRKDLVNEGQKLLQKSDKILLDLGSNVCSDDKQVINNIEFVSSKKFEKSFFNI